MLNYAGGNPITAYNLQRSLRFRASASAYLSRTPAVTGNQKTWTLSAWVKRGELGTAGTYHRFFSAQSGTGGARFFIGFEINTDNIGLGQYNGSSYDWSLGTNALFRDPSNWYHIVLAIDTTQATASDRLKLYVNGVQITSFSSITYPTLNSNTYVNTSGNTNRLGSDYNGTALTALSDCYLTEVNFIDGQALTPSSFGSTNSTTGVWQPAKYTGTYGTNGFYLPFTDNSALTTSSNAGLGKDFSGNGNYWTTNNISLTAGVTYDSMTDVPTLTSATAANFAVLNPLNAYAGSSGFVNANLTYGGASVSGYTTAVSSISVSSGKWYWEVNVQQLGTNGTIIGIASASKSWINVLEYAGQGVNSYGYYFGGTKYNNSSATSYGASYAANDVIGVALDMDAGTVTFYKNNVSQGIAFSGLTGEMVAAVSLYPTAGNGLLSVNFGQRPFAYTPPTGFVALNAYNLPDSTIKQGNKVMDATLYTGNGGTLSVTNTASFKPDLVWLKSRSNSYNHGLYDSVRGVQKWLSSSTTDAENAYGTSDLTAFNSNGFTLVNSASYLNNNNTSTYVAWQWQAGQGSSSSNTNGTITSTVSVNASAGFSVVTYTGTGANATVGHGLGVAPALQIVKSRGQASSWLIWHSAFSGSQYIQFDTGAVQSLSTVWNSTTPTSSVINLGSNGASNGNGITQVAYCFAPIAGYSAFGSYTGNGSADGTFVYTGFRPKYVMIKCSSASATQWVLFDTTRNPSNLSNLTLYASLSDAEWTGLDTIDILSNGFKLRNTNININTSGQTYVFASFAENPFKNALAR